MNLNSNVSKVFAFLVNDVSYFISHRLPIAIRLLDEGFSVHIVSPDVCPELLKDKGFIYHEIDISRKGKNPFSELKSIFKIIFLFKKIKPDIVHLVTIKPYLYGGIAARIVGVPAVVSAVAGLGTLFIDNRFKYKFLRALLFPFYKLAFGHNNQTIIFQNADDRDLLLSWLGRDKNTELIRGSGVDLGLYRAEPERDNKKPIVIMASRLLKDKGVVEFVEAARIVRSNNISAEFWLVGSIDYGNSNAISKKQLDSWEKSGLVKLLGYRNDIYDLFCMGNIIVLPSYREGLPRVLIEAAACARAVVTTDVPGCRDAINPGETGLLVPARKSRELADALKLLIKNEVLRKKMGLEGRKLAEEAFSIEIVVDKHMNIYNKLLGGVV